MLWIFGVVVIFFLIFSSIAGMVEAEADAKRTPAQRRQVQALREESRLTLAHGAKNPALVCPHCIAKGSVRIKAITSKKGVSGGKATGAILTGGVSLLATGLSRKEKGTQAHCDNCGSTWVF